MNDTAAAVGLLTASAGFLYGAYYARKLHIAEIEYEIERLAPDQPVVVIEDQGIVSQTQ